MGVPTKDYLENKVCFYYKCKMGFMNGGLVVMNPDKPETIYHSRLSSFTKNRTQVANPYRIDGSAPITPISNIMLRNVVDEPLGWQELSMMQTPGQAPATRPLGLRNDVQKKTLHPGYHDYKSFQEKPKPSGSLQQPEPLPQYNPPSAYHTAIEPEFPDLQNPLSATSSDGPGIITRGADALYSLMFEPGTPTSPPTPYSNSTGTPFPSPTGAASNSTRFSPVQTRSRSQTIPAKPEMIQVGKPLTTRAKGLQDLYVNTGTLENRLASLQPARKAAPGVFHPYGKRSSPTSG